MEQWGPLPLSSLNAYEKWTPMRLSNLDEWADLEWRTCLFGRQSRLCLEGSHVFPEVTQRLHRRVVRRIGGSTVFSGADRVDLVRRRCTFDLS